MIINLALSHRATIKMYDALVEFFTSNVNVVLAFVMLAVFGLVVAAFFTWRRTGSKEKPALMVVLAIVALANVLIWTVPTDSGDTPIDQAENALQEAEAN
ncbi:MAG: hypothetical protein AAF250_07950 [Pseudomonadota bacterium]